MQNYKEGIVVTAYLTHKLDRKDNLVTYKALLNLDLVL